MSLVAYWWTVHICRKNFWAREYITRNLKDWKAKRTKIWEKQNGLSKDCGTITQGCSVHVMGILEQEESDKGKGTEEIFEKIMNENFHKLLPETKPLV